MKKFLLIQFVCFIHIFLFAQTPQQPQKLVAPATPASQIQPQPQKTVSPAALSEGEVDGVIKLASDGNYTSYDGFPLQTMHWSPLSPAKGLAELKNIAKEDLRKLTLDYYMAFQKEKGLPFNKDEVEKIVNTYYDLNYKPVDSIPVLQKRHTFLYYRSLITRLSLLHLIEYEKEKIEKKTQELNDKINTVEKTVQLKTAPQQPPFLKMPTDIYEFLVILAFLISFGLLSKELISRR